MDNLEPLPEAIGLPAMEEVIDDNPHGSEWELLVSGDQGVIAPEIDRYFARYQSRQGYWADYFHFGGKWSLGAN